MTDETGQQHTLRTRLGEWVAPYVPDYFPVAWKLGLSISLLILCGMTILGTLLLNNQLSRMRDQADSFGAAIAQQLANTAREPLLADDTFFLGSNPQCKDVRIFCQKPISQILREIDFAKTQRF